MAEVEVPEMDLGGIEGWVEGLHELCMTCAYVPCICMLRLIEERVRELEGDSNGGGARDPGEHPASPQDQEHAGGPQVGPEEGGVQCSMKQEDYPASPPQKSEKVLSESRAPDQEGGESLSMRPGVSSASPPPESGSDQGGGEQVSTEQRPSLASPPDPLIRNLGDVGEGDQDRAGDGGVTGGADQEQDQQGTDGEGDGKVTLGRKANLTQGEDTVDEGRDDGGRTVDDGGAEQEQVPQGADEGGGEKEKSTNKVKFGRKDNHIQEELAVAVDGAGGAEDGDGNLGGLLEDEGSTSMKKGSFLPQEPTGEPDPPGTSKEEQRRGWKKMMEQSRKRQDEVEIEEKNSQESNKKRKRKNSMVLGGGGGKVSDVLSFWRRRESSSQTADQEQKAPVTRKRKNDEPVEKLSCVGVPVTGKKLCVERGTVTSLESEKGQKLKSKISKYNLASSSSAPAVGGDQGGQVAVQEAGHGGGRRAALSARARILSLSASHRSKARPDSAADGEKK